MGIRLIKGSFFSDQYEAANKHVVINKMLEDHFGADLLNKALMYEGQLFTVIGVVENFNLKPMMFNNRIKPTVIRASPESNYRYASLQVQGETNAINSEVELLWYELFPQQLYKGFMQERGNAQHS